MPELSLSADAPVGVIERIEAMLPQLSETMAKIGMLLLAEPTAPLEMSITDLAETFGMTLTGMKKHVSILEEARLVTTEKIGRVRMCRLGPRRLDEATAWITSYQQMLEARLDRLGDFLERTKGTI